jgi:SAM-dependent methyltransferase
MAVKIPSNWGKSSWEEKARENPLFAIMTTSEMESAPADDFSANDLELFFNKGKALYATHVKPLTERMADRRGLVVEYGCGAGRILRSVVEDGYRAAGIDISPTMLEHCRKLVPGVGQLYSLDANNRCAAESHSASVVYSYAVLQHIQSLANFRIAVEEMCRLLGRGGILSIQVNCADFETGDFNKPARTENYENYSLHFRDGSPNHNRHDQDQWSGVYIGHDFLTDLLSRNGVTLERWYYHNPKKLRAVWAVGTKT